MFQSFPEVMSVHMSEGEYVSHFKNLLQSFFCVLFIHILTT